MEKSPGNGCPLNSNMESPDSRRKGVGSKSRKRNQLNSLHIDIKKVSILSEDIVDCLMSVFDLVPGFGWLVDWLN